MLSEHARKSDSALETQALAGADSCTAYTVGLDSAGSTMQGSIDASNDPVHVAPGTANARAPASGGSKQSQLSAHTGSADLAAMQQRAFAEQQHGADGIVLRLPSQMCPDKSSCSTSSRHSAMAADAAGGAAGRSSSSAMQEHDGHRPPIQQPCYAAESAAAAAPGSEDTGLCRPGADNAAGLHGQFNPAESLGTGAACHPAAQHLFDLPVDQLVPELNAAYLERIHSCEGAGVQAGSSDHATFGPTELRWWLRCYEEHRC